MEEVQKVNTQGSLVVLLVSDMEKSQTFYQNVLGCEVTDFWVVRNGLTGLGFKLIQAGDPNDIQPNSKIGKVVWDAYTYVDDFEALDNLYKEFKTNGATVALEPEVSDFDWGSWKEFSIQDPDGYVIGFGAGKK
ncbi:MAG TPA: VOC family protein [Bacillales bacterium]|nr:VOC family protein [Bacillales bacterium]